jgi:two-component system chemotaxis response regulator CheB
VSIQKIRVLVVDDSLVAREGIRRGISSDRRIEVIGMAGDAYEAVDLINELEPDVITLDVNMPRMNGLEFLRRLMAQHPMPVVVISSSENRVLEALEAGAVDFVAKPRGTSTTDMDTFIREIVRKIKIAATSRPDTSGPEKLLQSRRATGGSRGTQIVAMGASTGGTEALLRVLRQLPANMPGIVIVQHMPPVFTRMYAERLNNNTQLHVKEAVSGDRILPGTALLAPGDYQMRVKRTEQGLVVECKYQEAKVSGHCPSVDVLFDSVANEVGRNSVGILLTGMGHDGARGLLNMRRKGAMTFGQDEASSVVYGMPKIAYELGAVATQCALNDIPGALLSHLFE